MAARNWIKPKDENDWLELRLDDITSTEISALFGLSPYLTKFELWHRKKDKLSGEFNDNDRMKWGRRLEDAIAKGVAEDQKWEITPLKDYCRIEGERLGSSFDYGVLIDGEKEAILEIKNVDSLAYRDGWITDEDGSTEAPLHIEMQVQHQMLVSGVKKAYIAALVGGNMVCLIEREADEAIHKEIQLKAKEFWESIDSGNPPEIDFERDAEFVAQLYNHAEPDKQAEPTEQIEALALKYKEAADAERDAKKQKDAAQAELLTLIGDAEKCRGEQFTISAGVVGEAEIKFTRKPYRNFRISWRKNK